MFEADLLTDQEYLAIDTDSKSIVAAAVEFAEQIRREVREFIGTRATYETVY